MRVRSRVSAGLLDAGFASLATFALGIVAARYLEPSVLGIYALFAAAFRTASVLPAQLLLLPVRVKALALSTRQRLGVATYTVRIATPTAALAALATTAAVFPALAAVSSAELVALIVTTVATAFLSPLQDHVRGLFHLAKASWGAAFMSGVQFFTAVVSATAMLATKVDPVWIPMGALAVANAVSLTTGLILARRLGESTPDWHVSRRDLIRSGRWLLAGRFSLPASNLLASTIVTTVAGPAILGLAEAARVVVQPVPVFSLGVMAALSPQSMQAARDKDRRAARSISRTYLRLMGTLGVVYFAIVAVPWAGNPLAALVPNAYTVGGLVAVTLLANLVYALPRPYRSELIGADRTAVMASSEFAGGAVRTLVAVTASLTQAFAMPLGLLALGTVRWVAFKRFVRALYERP